MLWPVKGQAQEVTDRAALYRLITKWNEAHNNADLSTLQTLYASRVALEGKEQSKKDVIALKEQFFLAHPDYKQQFPTSIRSTPLGNGLVKCTFTKSIVKDGVSWKYPAYLLMKREQQTYHIAGESDDDTDRTLSCYRSFAEDSDEITATGSPVNPLQPGPKATREMPEATKEIFDSAITSSGRRQDTLASVAEAAPHTSGEDSLNMAKLPIHTGSANETITFPLRYAYLAGGGVLLIGIIALIGLMLRPGKKKTETTPKKKQKKQQHDHYNKELSVVFEKFVLSLFDPLYFRAFRPRRGEQGSASAPDHAQLEFEFNHKQVKAEFAIECHYIPRLQHLDIEIATPQKVRAYRQLDEDDHDLYLVLGIEGRADDPKEIYFIPVREITRPFMTYPELQPYRKYGMFYYNAEAARLQ
jgi:hypothetical protein